MFKAEFGVENAKEISAALALIEDLPVYFNPLMRDWAGRTTMNYLWGMKNYAPPRSGSDYDRTGRFGSSWGFREVSAGQFSFENTHEAAELIVGEDQAWIHRGRWWKASERIDERIVDLALMLVDKLSKWPKS